MQLNHVKGNARGACLRKLFGFYAVDIEQTIYAFASRLSADYKGGSWDFYTLANGGFYMSPVSGDAFAVVCDNGFSGTLTPQAFGVTCCLYAFSHLSFSRKENLSTCCGEKYHQLLELLENHPEAGNIYQAID